MKTEFPKPGINHQVNLKNFTDDEKAIVSCLSKEWYITHGKEIRLGGSSLYRYVLMKPTAPFHEMFNLDREIVALLSPYDSFQPRTLDVISEVERRHQELRIERICSVIVSRDQKVEEKLRELLKTDPEAQIVVPFSYAELLEPSGDAYFFRNRFKSHFFSRDLFAAEAPLRKDLYFFGRTDLVHSLVNRHRSGEVSGLFGLRKTGKTSVIFGVQRALNRIEQHSVFIDCQNPAFHRSRWNHALFYVLDQARQQLHHKMRMKPEEQFTEEKAPLLFEQSIVKLHRSTANSILIIFDEIENITPTVSPSAHWRDEMDFVFFWQTLRSLFQKLSGVFSYLLVGTNPLCVELERIQEYDNPLFSQIPIEYMSRFDVPQTREMVRRLGRIMGIHFDEIIYGRLTEDFGGHPFLIRHACSVINRFSSKERPTRVDKALYEKGRTHFLRDYAHYIDMILNVLKTFFPDEYDMLTFLAHGETDTFRGFAEASPVYTNHLIGYGILEEHGGCYSFRIDAIRDHLLKTQKYKRLNLSEEEMWAEISERRNRVETKLRRLCRTQLQSFNGKGRAREIVLAIMGTPRNARNSASSYEDLFDARHSGILFEDLRKLIFKQWECFKNAVGPDRDEFDAQLKCVNRLRNDAHAKPLSHDEFQYFRVCIGAVEKKLDAFMD